MVVAPVPLRMRSIKVQRDLKLSRTLQGLPGYNLLLSPLLVCRKRLRFVGLCRVPKSRLKQLITTEVRKYRNKEKQSRNKCLVIKQSHRIPRSFSRDIDDKLIQHIFELFFRNQDLMMKPTDHSQTSSNQKNDDQDARHHFVD